VFLFVLIPLRLSVLAISIVPEPPKHISKKTQFLSRSQDPRCSLLYYSHAAAFSSAARGLVVASGEEIASAIATGFSNTATGRISSEEREEEHGPGQT
jgi:hypothetical protein